MASRRATILDGAKTTKDIFKVLRTRLIHLRSLYYLVAPVSVDSQFNEPDATFPALNHNDGRWSEQHMVSLVKNKDGTQPLKDTPALLKLINQGLANHSAWESILESESKKKTVNRCISRSFSSVLEVRVVPVSDDSSRQSATSKSSRPTLLVALQFKVMLYKPLLTATEASVSYPCLSLMETMLQGDLLEYAPASTSSRVFPIDEIKSSQEAAKQVNRDERSRCWLWVVPQLCHEKSKELAQPAGMQVTMQSYQLQALKFMVDRERAPLGVNSFLYVPLMIDGTRYWYSPGYGTFTTEQPPCVRGGMLCSAMGLGKTVICCALILAVRPQRKLGTVAVETRTTTVSALGKADEREHEMYRGGTLVVCALSLVTQWVEEAQVRAGGTLRIYSYHGTGRNRDPQKLGKYDVVVTTYSTMASDSHRMAAAKGPHYVPPLMRVRWHRIILDESHCLKGASTQQSRACRDLMATRRWCVTGTPVVGGLSDIRHQLKFVGMMPLVKPAFWKSFFNGVVSYLPGVVVHRS